MECSRNGYFEEDKLQEIGFSKRNIILIKKQFCKNLTSEMYWVVSETAKRLNEEQQLREAWIKSKFTDSSSLVQFQKMDFDNFQFVDYVIENNIVPQRAEFKSNFGVLFLHAATEKFAHDSTAFFIYSEKIKQKVSNGQFRPDWYMLWHDRYLLWVLNRDFSDYGFLGSKVQSIERTIL